MWHGEFRDARLVEVYDAEYGWSRDDDYFLALANERPRQRILDLGCGSGRLSLALARAGHAVTGVDPAPASLAAARAKPGAEAVVWVEGTSRSIPTARFDLALMTSHVAQVFVEDRAWREALADLARGLVAGGRLAFDARDPSARAWERWNPRDSRRRVTLSNGDAVEVWTELTSVRERIVEFRTHYEAAGREPLTSEAALRFRSEGELRASLAEAGLRVEHVFGGWNREPVGRGDGELLVIARR